MTHRLRANVRFPASSGMATWCRDQMAVRHGQAVHIREDQPAEESPINEIIDHGDEQTFRCDLPLMDEAHAADAYATLTDASVTAWAVEGDEGPGYVETHRCRHDHSPPESCDVVSRQDVPAES